MKYFIYGLTVFLLLSSTLNAKTNVTIGDKVVSFEQAPRLSEVLAFVESSSELYWPAGQLYRIDDEYESTVKKAFSNQINSLIAQKPELSPSLNQLHDYVKAWQLADFIELNVDFDAARIIESKNPIVNSGDYHLNFSTRPVNYYVSGMVQQQKAVLIKPDTCFAENILKSETLDSTNKDEVIVVQPDGQIIRKGIAYWNKDCRHVMPGSQVLFILSESLFSNTEKSLNDKLAELARDRILSR